MATLTIRDLDDDVRDELRVRAAKNGRSMEAEVRAILKAAVASRSDADGVGTRIHRRFAALGGLEVGDVERVEAPRAAELPG